MINSESEEEMGEAVKKIAGNKDAMYVLGLMTTEIIATSGTEAEKMGLDVVKQTITEMNTGLEDIQELLAAGDIEQAAEKTGEYVSKITAGLSIYSMGRISGVLGYEVIGFVIGWNLGDNIFDTVKYAWKKVKNNLFVCEDMLVDVVGYFADLFGIAGSSRRYIADPLVIDLDE